MHALMSGDSWQSVLVLDSDVENNIYTVSGLTANTNYTLIVAAVSIAGQSEDVIIQVLTADVPDIIWFIAAAAVVVALITILALSGVYTCGR